MPSKLRVIVNVKGGTGNQLFQVAYGMSLAKRLGGDLCLPKKKSSSIYTLTGLSPILQTIPQVEVRPRKTSRMDQEGWTYQEHKERLPSVLQDKDIFVDGYFQSSKFFANALPEVLEAFLPPLKALYPSLPTFDGPSVAIHIRRGDYLKYPKIHPCLGRDYYEKAFDALKVRDLNIIVCSDDLAWCKACPWLHALFPSIETEKRESLIHFPDLDVMQTLAFMTTCQYHIIANSSLSWWGAFLASQLHEEVKVVAPSRWFGTGLAHDTADMFEPSWIKV